jgi:RecA/RadA recombinase
MEMATISTGCKTLDDLLAGGLKTSVITLLFGAPNLGKTWLCYQVSCMCTRPPKEGGLGKKVLYLDTEGFFFTEDTVERFATYFKKRWPDCDPSKIEIVQVPDLFHLGEQFGMQFEVHQEEARVSVVTKYPTEKQKELAEKKGKSVVDTPTTKDKDWLEKAPVYKKVKSGDYGLVVIDSVTVPIKSEISATTQNFPARTSVLSALFGACYPIARRADVAILITDHLTANPMSPGYQFGTGDPWGGRNVLYYVKHIFGIYKPTKEYIEAYAPDGARVRRFARYRYPGLDPALVAVKLEKDRGYTDLPPKGAKPAKTEEVIEA